MIRFLRGELLEKSPTHVVILAGGVGYGLTVPLSTSSRLPQAGNTVDLHVHTRVREDAIDLYGFFTHNERDLFEQLLDLQGIAAKTACSILSHSGADEFRRAVFNGDLEALTRIPGIGKKSAQRIILEMKGVLVAEAEETGEGRAADEAVDALVVLGYQRVSAEKAVAKARQAAEEELKTEEVIKTALRLLR